MNQIGIIRRMSSCLQTNENFCGLRFVGQVMTKHQVDLSELEWEVADDIIHWCIDEFSHAVTIEGLDTFHPLRVIFSNEKDYMWFKLRWM